MKDYNLILGDCLEKMQDIPNKSVDMILADQPYGTTACRWDAVIPFDPLWKQLKRIVNEKAAIVMTSSQPFTTKLINSNIDMFKYCWVWEKSTAGNFVHSNYQPLKVHEDICIFSFGGSAQGSKKPMKYNPQFKKGKPYFKGIGQPKNENWSGGQTNAEHIIIENKTGLRKPRSVIYHKTPKDEGGYHSAQKPIGLMEYLIKTYTNKNDVVLDFAMGSGSTGVACINTNRKFIGIELNKKYYDIAKKRIHNVKR